MAVGEGGDASEHVAVTEADDFDGCRVNKILAALIVIGSLAMSGYVYAQDFEKGLKAFDVGDYPTALKQWRLLADRGDVNAQQFLAFMHEVGQGVVQDYIYAHMWYNIAASSGAKGAVSRRDEIAKKMTAADISKAQELARECVKKQYKGC